MKQTHSTPNFNFIYQHYKLPSLVNTKITALLELKKGKSDKTHTTSKVFTFKGKLTVTLPLLPKLKRQQNILYFKVLVRKKDLCNKIFILFEKRRKKCAVHVFPSSSTIVKVEEKYI